MVLVMERCSFSPLTLILIYVYIYLVYSNKVLTGEFWSNGGDKCSETFPETLMNIDV